ncbi:hypothetical protein BDR04DRAFT_1117035 [Suillus decipiens]|nr:hypothetical protein BDR04DRAFT_1117035 [Suillus decipiens]
MDEVEKLARKMHGLNVTDAAYAACYTHLAGLAPSAAQAWPPPRSHHLVSTVPAQTPLSYLPLPPLQTPSSNYQSNPTCFFCGGPHVMRTCSIAGEYLRAGRIIWDGQYFAFPDKSHICRTGNETFQQVIDARYTLPTSPTPATGSNAIPIDKNRRDTMTQPSTEIPSSAFISDSYFLQCAPVAGNHVVMATKDEKKKADVNAITRSKAKENPIPSESKDDLSPSPLIEAAPEPLDSAMKKPPAFSYESKAAAPDATQRIYKTILNMMVPHITVSDLLAISPELRKKAVEHCCTHRVPTSNMTLSASALASSIPPQVEHATPL